MCTLFVYLIAVFLEAIGVRVPFLYNIGGLVCQCAVPLSAYLFFDSPCLDGKELIDCRCRDPMSIKKLLDIPSFDNYSEGIDSTKPDERSNM